MSKIKNQLLCDLKEVSICAVMSAVINVVSVEFLIPSSISIAVAIVIGCEIGKAFIKERIDSYG